jgi:hypothetical protein
MTDISFSEPQLLPGDIRADLLPWNYLTFALGDILERVKGPDRILMILPPGGQPARFAAISGETLKDPRATVDFIAALEAPEGRGEAHQTGTRVQPDEPTTDARRARIEGPAAAEAISTTTVFIGPVTERPPNDGISAARKTTPIIAKPWDPLPAGIDRAVVIIDSGIAFWNARFRGSAGPRFLGIRYLDFETPTPVLNNGLDASDIATLCAVADTRGSPEVVNKLGELFPNSVFGTAANPNPEGFWHGTAVADLAAGAAAGEAETVAMFGLELPRAVVADYSGEMLSFVLGTIFAAVLDMTSSFPNVPVTIVMPLGFPAGPQDTTHPAVKKILSEIGASMRPNLKIVLPAGNHLQDRCHALLDASGSRDMIGWDLPPEDFSLNALEIFGDAGKVLKLKIAGPGQSVAADASLPVPSCFRFVIKGGVRIGVIKRFVDRGGKSRARIQLWQTALDSSSLAATPSGRWSIFSNGADTLKLWLFRDDRDPIADRSRPRRPSRFWSPGYILRDAFGAPPLTDDPGAAVRRSGTLSVLATAADAGGLPIEAVQADLRLGNGNIRQAAYSGRREDGAPLTVSELVDDGWSDRGVAAAANGTQKRVRMSGSSAAAGLRARAILGLGPAPPL